MMDGGQVFREFQGDLPKGANDCRMLPMANSLPAVITKTFKWQRSAFLIISYQCQRVELYSIQLFETWDPEWNERFLGQQIGTGAMRDKQILWQCWRLLPKAETATPMQQRTVQKTEHMWINIWVTFNMIVHYTFLKIRIPKTAPNMGTDWLKVSKIVKSRTVKWNCWRTNK